MILSTFSFEIINAFRFAKSEGYPDAKIFLCIPASTDDVTVDPNGIKML